MIRFKDRKNAEKVLVVIGEDTDKIAFTRDKLKLLISQVVEEAVEKRA